MEHRGRRSRRRRLRRLTGRLSPEGGVRQDLRHLRIGQHLDRVGFRQVAVDRADGFDDVLLLQPAPVGVLQAGHPLEILRRRLRVGGFLHRSHRLLDRRLRLGAGHVPEFRRARDVRTTVLRVQVQRAGILHQRGIVARWRRWGLWLLRLHQVWIGL